MLKSEFQLNLHALTSVTDPHFKIPENNQKFFWRENLTTCKSICRNEGKIRKKNRFEFPNIGKEKLELRIILYT